jgi:hypothetical protein
LSRNRPHSRVSELGRERAAALVDWHPHNGQSTSWSYRSLSASFGFDHRSSVSTACGVTPGLNTSMGLSTCLPLVAAPDVAAEQVAGQEAAPREQAVPAERAPVAAVPRGRAPGGGAPVGPGPQEQEPGSRGRAASAVPVRSTGAVALAVSVPLGGPAVPVPAPEERGCPGEVASPCGEEPSQRRAGSPVSVRPAAPRPGSASRPSAGSPSAPTKDWGPFRAQCWPVWVRAFPAVGQPPAVCRRAPAKPWVR